MELTTGVYQGRVHFK